MLHGQFCACVGSGRSLGKCDDGRKGCWGKKTKSTDCPPWPVDQTQITKKWYLYLSRLFDSPSCTGAANFSGLCTLSSCASVLRVSLAISEINFACLVVATVTINKLSFHHFVPLDGPMPASQASCKAPNMCGAHVRRGSAIPVCIRLVVWTLQCLEET